MALGSVVITGLGLLTPLGTNTDENLKGVLEGHTGIKKQGDNGPIQYYGKITQCPRPEVNSRLAGQFKFLNWGGQLALAASVEALRGHDLTTIAPEERAFYMATGDLSNTGCEFMYPATRAARDQMTRTLDMSKLNKAALNKVNPFFLLDSIANNPFSFISAYFGLMGDNTTIASLSPCGTIALDLAVRSIRAKQSAIALIAASTTWINPLSLYEMDGLGLLSRCRHGVTSYRPLDRRRDGFIPSEGGSAMVIEPEESAISRGAPILGRVLACSSVCENPPERGMSVPITLTKRAIEAALLQSGTSVDELAFVCLHGSGSRKGDLSELRSIKETFFMAVPLCALKPYTGHMGAASDLADIILSLKMLKMGLVPGTPNFTEADEGFTDLPITKGHTETNKKRFLCVSNGLGSQSVAVVVEVI
jgi:3-oxoacyl-(acyl-carrier-protein) synthase